MYRPIGSIVEWSGDGLNQNRIISGSMLPAALVVIIGILCVGTTGFLGVILLDLGSFQT